MKEIAFIYILLFYFLSSLLRVMIPNVFHWKITYNITGLRKLMKNNMNVYFYCSSKGNISPWVRNKTAF